MEEEKVSLTVTKVVGEIQRIKVRAEKNHRNDELGKRIDKSEAWRRQSCMGQTGGGESEREKKGGHNVEEVQ